MPDDRRLHWGAQALWQALSPSLPGLCVEVLASADSTNSRLLERARLAGARHEPLPTVPGALPAAPPAPLARYGRRSDDTQPCLLVAEQQTAGRGRLGRAWQAAPGASLTFSLSLVLEPPSWSGLSLAVGVALADALDPQPEGAAPRIALKWPNDLWCADAPGRGRKLGGVLIETAPLAERRLVVVGVGLNVRPLAAAAGFDTGFACLQELHPGLDAPRALHRVAGPLAQALLRFGAQGLTPFAERFRARDLLYGQAVSTTQADVPDGTAEGIDDEGALLVRRAGQRHRLVSGEVSVRPAGG